MKPLSSFSDLSNGALLDETVRLASRERCAVADLIAAIAEVDARRLYLGEGYSSMFTYCTRVLHLSEHAAYDRIEAARLTRRFPVVLEHLARGSLTLTNLRLLAPHLTTGNLDAIIEDAAHKSKHEVEQLIARLRPQPPVPSVIRRLPERRPATQLVPDDGDRADSKAAPVLSPVPLPPTVKPSVVQPLAPERYKVQFTVSSATREKLRRVQDLMRHTVPNGDLAAIFDRAISLLLDDLEKRKLGAASHPRSARPTGEASRHIPASIKRQVWQRDEGRCAYVGSHGRCNESGFLEFHHVRPYAIGGRAVAENIELRCRAHNAYEAEPFFNENFFVREARPEMACGNWFRNQPPVRSSGGSRAKGLCLKLTL